MKTQGQRQDFNWRPNDNSSQTRMRYDLEMNHWLKSLKGSSGGGNGVSGNWGPTFAVLGLVFHFVVVLVWFILIMLSNLIVWLVNLFHTEQEYEVEPADPNRWTPSGLNNEEMQDVFKRARQNKIDEQNTG
jgi:hypothetical protein